MQDWTCFDASLVACNVGWNDNGLCRELWCRQLSLFRHSGTAEDTKALKLCWEIGCQCWGRQCVLPWCISRARYGHPSVSPLHLICSSSALSLFAVLLWRVGGGRLGATCGLNVPFMNGSRCSAAGLMFYSILPSIAKQHLSWTQFWKCWVPVWSTPHWQLTTDKLSVNLLLRVQCISFHVINV
jgi:hypothetical protein